MKARFVADLAFNAWQVGYTIGHFLPYAVEEFVGWSVARSFDWMMFDDQRVQFDHFIVIMQHGNGQLARYVRGQRSDVREKCLFRHVDEGAPARTRILYALAWLRMWCFWLCRGAIDRISKERWSWKKRETLPAPPSGWRTGHCCGRRVGLSGLDKR